jgi:hypothetical protein
LNQTRADLLDAAVRVVNGYIADGPRPGDPPVDLLPFLRLEEVLDVASELARRRLEEEGRLLPEERIAPLTPGAFYKAFADDYRDGGRGAALTAFRRVVTRHMVEDPLLTKTETYIEIGKQLAEKGEPWSELVRIAVEAEYHRWAETPALILMSALALHAEDDDVDKWTRALDNQQLDSLEELYTVLLDVYRRRMREGFELRQMAAAVSDMIAGMALNARFVPEARDLRIQADVDGNGIKEWHLCAFTAYSIYERFTEVTE